MVTGLAGCSSEPDPAPLGPGMIVAGSAELKIDDGDVGITHAVRCSSAGDLTTITTGTATSGVTTLLSSGERLSIILVDINDVGGFTGSYNAGLSAIPAEVELTGRTYEITGTAEGFNASNPSARVPGNFAVTVAC